MKSPLAAPKHRLPPNPGIAVITYKRPDHLDACLSAIRKFTTTSHRLVVACDSDEDDDTRQVCARWEVPLIMGINRGVAWNKNRALYYFMSRTDCDPFVLLEDDARPTSEEWQQLWVEAASRWGHVNYSHPSLVAAVPGPVRGSGTPADPHVLLRSGGACIAVTRNAIEQAGYLDPRFRGYGYGHVEWSRRHARALFDERIRALGGGKGVYVAISGALKVVAAPSFRNEADVGRNFQVLHKTDLERSDYTEAWIDQEEEAVLKDEVRNAIEPEKGDERARAARSEERRSAPIGLSKLYAGLRRSVQSLRWPVVVSSHPEVVHGAPVSDHMEFSEEEYLAANPDVAAAVARGEFKSGLDHYTAFGRRANRLLRRPSRPLFFCHIPKTAGPSVRSALERSVGPFEVVPDWLMMSRQGGHYPPVDLTAVVIRHQGPSIRLFRGHYHYSCVH